MKRQENRRRLRLRRRGFTTAELMISVSILLLVMLIVIPAMIFYGRTLKGVRMQQRMQKDLNLFVQEMNHAMTQTYELVYSNEEVITFGSRQSSYVEDTDSATGFTYSVNSVNNELIYRDVDDDPETIHNNQLVWKRTVKNPSGATIEQTEEVLLNRLSPLYDDEGNALPFFDEITEGQRPFVLFQGRMGDRIADRDNLTDEELAKVRADDAFTGPGYEGFVIRYTFIPYNRST